MMFAAGAPLPFCCRGGQAAWADDDAFAAHANYFQKRDKSQGVIYITCDSAGFDFAAAVQPHCRAFHDDKPLGFDGHAYMFIII